MHEGGACLAARVQQRQQRSLGRGEAQRSARPVADQRLAQAAHQLAVQLARVACAAQSPLSKTLSPDTRECIWLLPVLDNMLETG